MWSLQGRASGWWVAGAQRILLGEGREGRFGRGGRHGDCSMCSEGAGELWRGFEKRREGILCVRMCMCLVVLRMVTGVRTALSL